MHIDLMIVLQGSYTSIVRQTKQIAATLGVSLVVLRLLWGTLMAMGVQYAHHGLR